MLRGKLAVAYSFLSRKWLPMSSWTLKALSLVRAQVFLYLPYGLNRLI